MTSDVLDAKIKMLIAELIDSAPPAPELRGPGLEQRHPSSGRSPLRTDRRRWATLFGLGAAVTLGVVLALVVVPGPTSTPLATPAAAAAQLRRIAAATADQPPRRLTGDEWLFRNERASVFAQLLAIGKTPTPGAQATVRVRLSQWSNGNGVTCTFATVSPARFASSANQAAWNRAGLLDSPTKQPLSGCALGPGSEHGPVGVIDVSKLPLKPSVLAHELESGTTGVTSLDEISNSVRDAAFERAADILIGPTTGATPTFDSALYDALATLPQIRDLGTLAAHSGDVGVAFGARSVRGQAVIIVDPKNGELVEARNIQDQSLVNVLTSPSYLSAAGFLAFQAAHSFQAQVIVQWLDPVGGPSIVRLPCSGFNVVTSTLGHSQRYCLPRFPS